MLKFEDVYESPLIEVSKQMPGLGKCRSSMALIDLQDEEVKMLLPDNYTRKHQHGAADGYVRGCKTLHCLTLAQCNQL
jgi:hypothetical protein